MSTDNISTGHLQVIQPAEPPSVAHMLQDVIKAGITEQNVAALERLCGLYERVQSMEAEKQFAAARVEFQRLMPTIVASTVIPNRGKYERYEDIYRVASPIMSQVGLSTAFRQELKENRITQTCLLTHVGGVTKEFPFTVRVSGKADTETQADCKASTIAKRNAFCVALNIVIAQDCLDSDHDAAIEGGKITPEQAESLRQRVMATASDEAAFLKLAGAKDYKDIRVAFYQMLDLCLKRREKVS
jgi:hypothetical protein